MKHFTIIKAFTGEKEWTVRFNFFQVKFPHIPNRVRDSGDA